MSHAALHALPPVLIQTLPPLVICLVLKAVSVTVGIFCTTTDVCPVCNVDAGMMESITLLDLSSGPMTLVQRNARALPEVGS